jgi:hypothetical protein
VIALLPPGDRPAGAWLAALGGDVGEDREVGAGARRASVDVPGGYTSVAVRASVRADRVVEVRVHVRLDVPESPDLAAALAPAWAALETTKDERGLHHRWRDPARAKAHRAALDEAFGPRGTPDVPQSLRAAFDLLDDPLADLTYGRMCYEDGSPPAGREAVERVAKARAAPSLRALLRSPNPEGRVYAVEALERLAKDGVVLADVDRRAIDVIRSSASPIRCCAGCTVFDATAASALRASEEEGEAR